MRAEQVSCRSGGVGGSHQIVIQQQRRPLANQQANTLERFITKIGQDATNKIRADWASMEMDRVGVEW